MFITPAFSTGYTTAVFKFLVLIVSGSPADRSELEVADEILEVNGTTLENSSHTQVIAHIHEVSSLESLQVAMKGGLLGSSADAFI